MYDYQTFAGFFSDSALQQINDPREWYLGEMLRMNADPTKENPSDSLILRQPGYPAWMCDPIPHTQSERFDIEQLWIRNISTTHREYESLELYCNPTLTQEQYNYAFPDNDDQFRQFTRDFGKQIEGEAGRSGLTLCLAVFHTQEWDPDYHRYLTPHFHFLVYQEYPIA